MKTFTSRFGWKRYGRDRSGHCDLDAGPCPRQFRTFTSSATMYRYAARLIAYWLKSGTARGGQRHERDPQIARSDRVQIARSDRVWSAPVAHASSDVVFEEPTLERPEAPWPGRLPAL